MSRMNVFCFFQRCVFSSDPAVSSSIFVGAEREENLIRTDPDKSEFTVFCLLFFSALLNLDSFRCGFVCEVWVFAEHF